MFELQHTHICHENKNFPRKTLNGSYADEPYYVLINGSNLEMRKTQLQSSFEKDFFKTFQQADLNVHAYF